MNKFYKHLLYSRFPIPFLPVNPKIYVYEYRLLIKKAKNTYILMYLLFTWHRCKKLDM